MSFRFDVLIYSKERHAGRSLQININIYYVLFRLPPFFLNEPMSSRAPRKKRKTASPFRSRFWLTADARNAPKTAVGTAVITVSRAAFLSTRRFFMWKKSETAPIGRKNIRFIPCAFSCGISVNAEMYKSSIPPPPSPIEPITAAKKPTTAIKNPFILKTSSYSPP